MFYNEGKYTGEVMNGVPNGQGSWTHPSYGTFVGRFADGYLHGRGKLTFPDGSHYAGEWHQSNIVGQGVMVFNDGSLIKGEWKSFEPWNAIMYDAAGKIILRYEDGVVK